MKAKDLRGKSLSELNQTLQEALSARFKLRMQHGNGQLGKTDQLKKNKREVARIKTLMHEQRAEEKKA